MKWIVERLKEPSTYAGLSGIAMAAGISGDAYQAAAGAAAGLFGLLAFVLREKSGGVSTQGGGNGPGK